MPSERRQFALLHRDFLLRLVDLELLSSHGDVPKLLGQFGALLAAFSFVLAVLIIPKYGTSQLPGRALSVAAWGDEEFLISTTMAVAGLFAVVAWNAVLPDRRDSFVLGPLPVRIRTVFAAKLTAMLAALGVSILAVNAFTGLGFPKFDTGLRGPASYWITMSAAGLFVFCTFLAVQGLAAHLLSYRLFLRVSGFLQIVALFAVLSLYFLTPPLATPYRLAAPENQHWLAWLPSFWFLGLFQQLRGHPDPVFAPLAARAVRNLSVVLAAAAGTYALMYFRHVRRIIEQPDIAPADRTRPAARLTRFAVSRLFSRPLDRAILLFTARTLARSRQHRFLLAAYAGVGLAIAFAYAKSLVSGFSRAPWTHVTLPGLTIGLVLLTFAVIGARAVFALPVLLRANWIFRMTTIHPPHAYFAAVRKSLLALAAAPVCLALGVAYLAIWPKGAALEHIAVLLILSFLLADFSLYQFRKIPFACSYLPGKANLKVKFGVYAGAFIFALSAATALELAAMETVRRFLFLLAVLLALAGWARHRWAEFAAGRYQRLQFEDLATDGVLTLDLGGDNSEPETYVYAEDPLPRRSPGKRIGLGLLALVACGFTYEQLGERQFRHRFPQIGRSVDIGGRSLNIYCSGSGTPTVIFEAVHAAPGYSWLPIQRAIAKNTRACWYDRAGFGWSDSAPHVNTVDNMARDLHRLLRAAGIPPPYLLVGASMGGFIIRVFRHAHPDAVAGMVFVDASHEDVLQWIPDVPTQRPPEFLRRPGVFVATLLARFGAFRLFASDTDSGSPPAAFTPQESHVLLALESQPKAIAAEINEAGGGLLNFPVLQASGGFGDTPVIVLTAGLGLRRDQQQAWIRLHQTLAWKSSRGRQVVLDGSTHMIQANQPEAVLNAVREVLAQIRS